ncbi:hypothetical protein PMAYCL1PPCAC_15878, partial [Pristionchus mayeri]
DITYDSDGEILARKRRPRRGASAQQSGSIESMPSLGEQRTDDETTEVSSDTESQMTSSSQRSGRKGTPAKKRKRAEDEEEDQLNALADPISIPSPVRTRSASRCRSITATPTSKRRSVTATPTTSRTSTVESGDSGRPWFNCKLCPYKTQRSNTLKSHEENHTGKHPLKCPFCSYTARNEFILNAHIELHKEETGKGEGVALRVSRADVKRLSNMKVTDFALPEGMDDSPKQPAHKTPPANKKRRMEESEEKEEKKMKVYEDEAPVVPRDTTPRAVKMERVRISNDISIFIVDSLTSENPKFPSLVHFIHPINNEKKRDEVEAAMSHFVSVVNETHKKELTGGHIKSHILHLKKCAEQGQHKKILKMPFLESVKKVDMALQSLNDQSTLTTIKNRPKRKDVTPANRSKSKKKAAESEEEGEKSDDSMDAMDSSILISTSATESDQPEDTISNRGEDAPSGKELAGESAEEEGEEMESPTEPLDTSISASSSMARMEYPEHQSTGGEEEKEEEAVHSEQHSSCTLNDAQSEETLHFENGEEGENTEAPLELMDISLPDSTSDPEAHLPEDSPSKQADAEPWDMMLSKESGEEEGAMKDSSSERMDVPLVVSSAHSMEFHSDQSSGENIAEDRGDSEETVPVGEVHSEEEIPVDNEK